MNNPNALAEPLLSLRDIVMRFGTVQALRGVDFDLLPGEVHGLLGQNGAGKSTTMRMLTGNLAPSQGSVKICRQILSLLLIF